nr:MAG TPA: hypothetical protein [Caudoviricetes sp.]
MDRRHTILDREYPSRGSRNLILRSKRSIKV